MFFYFLVVACSGLTVTFFLQAGGSNFDTLKFVITAVIGTATFVAGAYFVWLQTESYKIGVAKSRLEKELPLSEKEDLFSNQTVIPRVGDNNRLTRFLDEETGDNILALSGIKGVGKSTVLKHLLKHLPEKKYGKQQRRRGVVFVLVAEGEKLDTNLAKVLGVSGSNMNEVMPAFRAFKEKHGYLPVVVVDLKDKPDCKTIRSIVAQCRNLTTDPIDNKGGPIAQVIVDMSSLNSAQFMVYEPRVVQYHMPELTEKQVFVELLSVEDLTKLIGEVANAEEKEEKMNELYNMAGGRPLEYKELLKKNTTLLKLRDQASLSLNKFLESPDHKMYEPALRLLATKGYEEGITQEEFNKALKPSGYAHVEVVLKGQNLLHYDFERDCFVFHTRSRYQLAKEHFQAKKGFLW